METDYLYLHVLPQRTAEEVGVFGDEGTQALGFALAVVWDTKHGFRSFTTEQQDELINVMKEAKCVVGYNCRAYDFKLLQFQPQVYCDLLFEILKTTSELVPLKRAFRDFGTRPVLSKVHQMRKRWRKGKKAQVITALSRHVGAIRRLHQHILQHGWMLIETLDGGTKRVPITLAS